MAVHVHAHGLGEEPVDRDGFKEGWRSFLESFPDLRVDVGDVIAEADRCAIRISCSGHHLGTGMGVPPTGKLVTFHCMSFTRWEKGQIVEGWNLIDMASIYRQISG
jgi:predicted ester cyclase